MKSATIKTNDSMVSIPQFHSIIGRNWCQRSCDQRNAQHLAQQHDLDPIIANILIARGFTSETVESYLQPKLRDLMPHPFILKDMEKAVQRIAHAIINKQKIAIFGDYDVDGATSSALLLRYIRHFGLSPTLYIPDRMTEGYGPNINAFSMLINDDHDLIISVDCGIVAFEPMALAHQRGVDVVILDHHQPSAELPLAHAIVNPNRLDETQEYGYLAACGVTFMTLVGLSQVLRDTHHLSTPDLLNYLDLVALGTVCDVVPLISLNRALVTQGLKILSKQQNIGLRALSNIAGIEGKISAYHLGFIMGPRINAGGRISTSHLGATLLSTEDENTAIDIAQELEQLNLERQIIEKSAIEEAIGMVTKYEEQFTHMIMLAHRQWHPGVIGLVASRLKEQFQKPTCIIALDKNGKGKASGRSIQGIDLGALVLNAKNENKLIEGGGHAMAAGFSVQEDQIESLHRFFTDALEKKFGKTLPTPEIMYDGYLSLSGITLALAQQLDRMEPFGAGNAAPKLVLSPVYLDRISVIKEKHLRLAITDESRLKTHDIMLFNQAGSLLHSTLHNINPQQKLALVGSLKVNSWQGREKAQFIADDIALME